MSVTPITTDCNLQVELGGYVGYSCILFGDALRKAGGDRYYSLEMNPEFAAVILSLVDLAGLSDIVKVVVGSSDASLARLCSEGLLRHIDFMFLDHYKPAYVTDLKLCEQLDLIKPGSILVADNVVKPGNPPYLSYIRSSVQEKKRNFQNFTEDGVNGSMPNDITRQYEKRYGIPSLKMRKGNPNLVYESTLVKSFEPTGVPVSDWGNFLEAILTVAPRTELRYPDALMRKFRGRYRKARQ
jgi:catechol O-methyltransferase